MCISVYKIKSWSMLLSYKQVERYCRILLGFLSSGFSLRYCFHPFFLFLKLNKKKNDYQCFFTFKLTNVLQFANSDSYTKQIKTGFYFKCNRFAIKMKFHRIIFVCFFFLFIYLFFCCYVFERERIGGVMCVPHQLHLKTGNSKNITKKRQLTQFIKLLFLLNFDNKIKRH